ncbi:hypothetical protein [Cellulomonas triticagri]|uniref:Integral membrane protein n=1 Tax=Cellulomonas triticagri TaxID=2483352 RepID=A0A3M2J5P3_9CELL|nr:hypothetical protein [Cellulomonas triticagri]RMI09422.1 hypothetical protein EBM89_10260 [Cellulomonas triticagri]
MTAPRPRRVPRLLIAHAVVVIVLSLVLVLLAVPEAPDANIGAGLAYLAVLPFGLPWTALLLLAPPTWPSGALLACAIGAAVLNVVLHGLLRVHLARRQAARDVALPSGPAPARPR